MRFSIVVPTRRRPRQLSACLDSLVALEYPRTDFEVIVVDDGGGIPAAMIERARATINVKLVTQVHAGPATARNRGVAAATGTWVAFTDDDCTVDRGWLRALENALEACPDALIGGGTVVSGGSSAYDVASQNVLDFLYEYFAKSEVAPALQFFATNNVACRRDLLLSLGGFDEAFPRAAAEDRDFCERWREAGRSFRYHEDARVTHHLDSSLTRYVRQHLRYGQGASYLRVARRRRGHSSPRVEPLTFYFRLVTFPLRRGISLRAAGLMVLAILSQAAYVAGFYSERILTMFRRPRGRPATESEPATIVEPRQAAP